MAGDLVFGIRLTADGSGYVGTVRLAREETEKLGTAGRQASSGVQDLDKSIKSSLASAAALGSAIGILAVEALRFGAQWATAGVSAAAALKDLHDVTGSSVEDLSRLTNIAKVSGTSAEAFSDVIGRLAVRLSGTDEESTKAGKALAALGIKARDPAQAIQELAGKFAGYKDDINKAAYAQEIWGRGGERLLPLLKDIAEQQGIAATVTTRQAEEAERLEKSLRALTVQASLFRDELLSGVVPALNSFLAALRGGSTVEKLGLFSITPDDRKDLEGAITQTKAAIEDVTKLKAALENPGAGVFGAIAAWFSKDDLAIANSQLEAMTARLKGLTDLANTLNPDRNIHKNADRYFPQESIGAPPKSVGGARARAEVDEYAKALENLAKQAALADEELEAISLGEQVVPATKELLRLMSDPAWGKFSEEQRATIKAQAESVIATQKQSAALKKAIKDDLDGFEAMNRLREEFREQQTATARSVEALVSGLDLETKTMFLSNEEREKAIALAKLQQQYDAGLIPTQEALAEAIAAVGDAYDRRNAAASLKKSLEEQDQLYRSTYEDISNNITDSLLGAWANGKSGAQALVNDLKQMFANLVLRPIIQAAVAPIAGGIASLVAGPVGASPLGALGGIGNFSGGSLISSLFGASEFAAALAGDAFLPAALGAAGAGSAGLGSLLGGGLGSLGLGALGLGVGALAIPLLGKLFGKKKTPKTGGFGTTGNVGRYVSQTQGDETVQALANDLQGTFDAYLEALGGTGSADFALGYQGRKSFTTQAGAYVGGQQVYAGGGAAGKDEASVKASLELEGKRAILAALQASDLPESIAGVIRSMDPGSASGEAVDNLLAMGGALRSVTEALDGGAITDAQAAWDAAQLSSTEKLRQMGAELATLARNADGSASSTQNLAAATQAFRQASTEAVFAIRQVQQSLTDMFAATREQVEFAGLDKQAGYDLYRSKGANLLELISTSEDPALINEMAQKINSYFLSAFNLLDPTEQVAHKQEFLDRLNNVDTLTNERLGAIADTIQTDSEGPFKAVNDALSKVVASMGDSATKNEATADKLDSIADKFAVAVEQLVTTPIGITVEPGSYAVGGP